MPYDFKDLHVTPLGLDDDILKDIYYENHKRLHPTARPLDRELIAYRAKEMLDDIKARRAPYDSDERYALEESNMRKVLEYFNKK